MLAEFAPALPGILLPHEQFYPYPKVSDRAAWQALPLRLREEAITSGEAYLDYRWPSLPATLFMDFRRTGNRTRFEEKHFARRKALGRLVMAECVEGKGRFLDDIADGIWHLCEESFWGIPAHNYIEPSLPDVQAPSIDLFAGETAGLLAWTYYLLGPVLEEYESMLCRRIEYEVDRRILTPFLSNTYYRWQGLDHQDPVNNWNPWCNYNCLVAFLLVEKEQKRRIEAVGKILRSLDRFLDFYGEDGGCDEGPGYWSKAAGSLFDCLEILTAATAGKINVFNHRLIKEMGQYLVRVHIAGKYYINFADAKPELSIDSALVWAYGERTGDADLKALAASSRRADLDNGSQAVHSYPLRYLRYLFTFTQFDLELETPYLGDVWLADLQVMAAREQPGSSKGLYLAAKGGHNDESHNHNDVGQFLVYIDGKPVLIDPGVEDYTAKTFSSRRYEIWTMQSAYHNLPIINGCMQEAGRGYRATAADYNAQAEQAELSLNLEAAYPKAAGVGRYQRYFRLKRTAPPFVEITDDLKLQKEQNTLVFNYLTPLVPKKEADGSVTLSGAAGPVARLVFSGMDFALTTQEIWLEDKSLKEAWGEKLYRLQLGAVVQKAARLELKIYRHQEREKC